MTMQDTDDSDDSDDSGLQSAFQCTVEHMCIPKHLSTVETAYVLNIY